MFCVSLDKLIHVLLAFVVLGLVFFGTKPRDWLGRKSLKLPILCRVGRKTITQSVNLCFAVRCKFPADMRCVCLMAMRLMPFPDKTP